MNEYVFTKYIASKRVNSKAERERDKVGGEIEGKKQKTKIMVQSDAQNIWQKPTGKSF